LQAVRGISDLITTPGLINLDFADIRTIMKDSGLALMGTGIAAGQNRAIEAAKLAICSPLLEDLSITGATGILINITGSSHMTLFEVNEASKLVQQECHEDANIIFGTVIDETMGDNIRITVIATGFGNQLNRMKQKSKKDSMPVPHKDWLDSVRANDALEETTISDIFNDIHAEISVNEAPAYADKQTRVEPVISENPRPIFMDDKNDIAQHLSKGGNKSYDETSLYAKKPASPWGVIPTAQEPTTGARATPPRISRQRTENNQERSEFKQILNDLNLSEGEADEFDIPAFLRRSAD
jgi:hypothetical protein